MPPDRTSTLAVLASAPMRCHPDCSGGCRRLASRSPHGHEQHARTTDATDKGPRALQSYGRCLVALYNLRRPHQALGWRTPDEATSANRRLRRHWPPDAMPRRCREFVDSRLRRSPPDRASAVPYGQAGENAMRFPHLAHRSAAVHKLHSTPQQDGMNLISGKGETSSRLPALSLFLPGSCPNNRNRRNSVSL
jgi:hypothetical protein